VARVTLHRLAHSYRRQPETIDDFALKEMNHIWDDGEAYALLGPSGCGKTTLLNIISGLLRPTEGQVLFDDRDVTDLSTVERNIAQVFQHPVVYDTMTVAQNLAFPLKNRGVDGATIAARVNAVAEMLGLISRLDRRADDLTADLKQKIALGRGLVRDDVSAILFDEPLTAIDPHLKISLRRQLKEIHERRKLTLIYVTHDQMEALTFADRVVVMHEGEVVQADTPQVLFERPAHTFVGYFIGSPGMNLMPCQLDGDAAVVDGCRVPLAESTLGRVNGAGGTLELGIRPEFLKLVFRPKEGAARVRVNHVEDLGTHKIITVAMGGQTLRVRAAEDFEMEGDIGWLVFPPDRCLLYRDSRLV
jgi:glycerol transport system ATP-binding protein